MRHSEHLSALAAGARLNIYLVENVLGAGGFGITYRAREDITERIVAIKEYLPSSLAVRGRDGASVRPVSEGARLDFEWGLSRFREEAKLLIGLKHPNIVPVLSYFEANGTGYLVMEFQDGHSLGDMLAGGAVLREAELVGILGPLLDGVEAVHRHGFLHRDIKPDNIFVRADGTPVLLDFGAARQALGQHSKSLTAVLTEGYAPYEQYHRDGNQGPWTDIYAIGAVMLRGLLGEKPAEAPKRVEARFRGAPDPLEEDFIALRARVAPGTARAVEAALALREIDRPQSIAALRALLAAPRVESSGPASRAASGVPSRRETLIVGRLEDTGVAPATLSASTPRAPRRKRLAAYAAAGAVLFAGAAFGAFIIAGGDGPGVATGPTVAEKTAAARAAEEAKRRADAEAQRQADAEKARLDADRRRREEERARSEADGKKRAEEEAARRRAAEEESRRAAEAERKAAEERARAEEQRKKQDEARKEAEERAKTDEQRRKEEGARKAEEERAKAEEERRRAADEDARRKAEEAKKAEAERAAEEAKRKADAEAKQRMERAAALAGRTRDRLAAAAAALRAKRYLEAKRAAAEAAGALRELVDADPAYRDLAALRRQHEAAEGEVKRAIAVRVTELVRAARDAMKAGKLAEAKQNVDEAASLDASGPDLRAAIRELALLQRQQADDEKSKAEAKPPPPWASSIVGTWSGRSTSGATATLTISGFSPQGRLRGQIAIGGARFRFADRVGGNEALGQFTSSGISVDTPLGERMELAFGGRQFTGASSRRGRVTDWRFERGGEPVADSDRRGDERKPADPPAQPRYTRQQLTQIVYERIMSNPSQSLKMYKNSEPQKALYVCIDWDRSDPAYVAIRGYGYGYGHRSESRARDSAMQYCRPQQLPSACECTLVDGSGGPALVLPGSFLAKYAQ